MVAQRYTVTGHLPNLLSNVINAEWFLQQITSFGINLPKSTLLEHMWLCSCLEKEDWWVVPRPFREEVHSSFSGRSPPCRKCKQCMYLVDPCQFVPSCGFLSLPGCVDPWIHALGQLLSHMTSHCFLIRSFSAHLLTKLPQRCISKHCIPLFDAVACLNEVLSLMEASS